MTSTPRLDAYLASGQFSEEFENMSAQEVNRLSPAEYARMTGRSLVPSISTVSALASQASVTQAPVVEQQETPEAEPVSVRDMSYDEYEQYRATQGLGQAQQYGVGLFNQPSTSKAVSNGRHAMVISNVEAAPRISRPNLVGVDRPNLDTRPVQERFSSPANLYRPE